MNEQKMTYHADQIIMREGELCDAMYKILSGSVAVYIRYKEADERLIGIYSKGRCFGEMNVLADQPVIQLWRMMRCFWCASRKTFWRILSETIQTVRLI